MVKITAYTFRFFHSHSALAVLFLTALLTAVHPSDACTVFILTNGKQTITAETKNLFSDVTNGKLRYDDLSDDFSNNLKQNEAGVKSMLERLGKLNSIELIHQTKNQELMEYSYFMKFDNVRILWQFILDDKNKIHDFNTLSACWIR